MNHPTNEQWIAYRYNELKGDERAELRKHLETCPNCAAVLESWRQAGRELDAWKVRVSPARTGSTPITLKWAAVGTVIFVAFYLGTLRQVPSGNFQAVAKAQIPAELQQEFLLILEEKMKKAQTATVVASEERTKELLKLFADQISTTQRKDLQPIYAALDKIDSQRAADYIALKKELDALAINADAELRSTARNLMQLATVAQISTRSPQE
jgi:hypothetical protein